MGVQREESLVWWVGMICWHREGSMGLTGDSVKQCWMCVGIDDRKEDRLDIDVKVSWLSSL
jgi:hypothetical protein